jgi:hypothetical protein
MFADSHQFKEELDPDLDPDSSEKLDPDPFKYLVADAGADINKKLDPDSQGICNLGSGI